MNIYLLVEGKRCERKLYPAWLSVLAPHLKHAKTLSNITQDNYFLISGEGYPSILDVHLPNAIRDVEKTGLFDILIVALDSDEDSVVARQEAVAVAVRNAAPKLTSTTLEVIVQNRCIETWLLANRKIFVRNPKSSKLKDYINHYDARQRDPEEMPIVPDFNTHAQFHCAYLKAIFQERELVYTKRQPGEAASQAYLDQIIKRTRECPDHIKSFSRFLEICEKLK